MQDEIKRSEIEGLQLDGIELLELVGRGGISSVYKARQLSLDRIVAVKLLKDYVLEGEAQALRFQNEARLTASLEHSNIVKTMSYGLTKDGQPYIVMEYLEGKSLADELKEHGILQLGKFRDVFIPILAALEFAHNAGLVHRDIKPGNIVLLPVSDGSVQVKLVDFGIAKILAGPENSAQHLTKTGALLGSPNYMSPEQCIAKEVDARSDIYSIACVMYEALIGEPLFTGNTALEVMAKHSSTAAPTVAELSRKIDINADLLGLLLSALAKDPSQRPQSAQKFREELNKCLDKTTLSRVPRLKSETLRRIPRMYLVLAVLVLIVLIADFCMISSRHEDRKVKNASEIEMNPDTLIRRAKALQDKGEPAAALQGFEKVFQQVRGKKSQDVSLQIAYFSAAMCCQTLAEEKPGPDKSPDPELYNKAIAYADKAIEKSIKTGSRSSSKESYQLRIYLLAKRKDRVREVLNVVKLADEHFEQKGTEYLEIREESAHRLMENDMLAEAEALINETAEISRKTYGKDSYQDVRGQIERAFLYAKQGKIAESNKIIETYAPEIIAGGFGAEFLNMRHNLLSRRRCEILEFRIFPTLRTLKNPSLMEKLIVMEESTHPKDFKNNPKFASRAYQLLGDAYAVDKKTDKAMMSYEKAFKIQKDENLPYDYSLLKSLVILYKNTKVPEKENFYRRLLATTPCPKKN